MAHDQPAWLLALDAEALRRRCGDLSHLAHASLVSVEDGPQRGARQLHLTNACGLTLEIEVDRACDIGQVRWAGVPIGWTSPSGLQHRAPSHETDNGLGLLRSFSGLLVTCGLDHTGAPATGDAGHFGYPLRKNLVHPLHGKLAESPSRLLGWGVDWAASPPVMWCEALIRQAAVFGEAFELRRRIEVDVAEPTVKVRDQVRNVAFRPSPHQILYHVNFGYPLLSGSAALHLRTANGAVALRHQDPSEGVSETVDEFTLQSDAAGWGHAVLHNPDLDMAAHLSFDRRTLPGFARWLAPEPGTYVTGLEPHNGVESLAGQSAAVQVLPPGQSVNYQLRVSLLSGARAGALTRGGFD